MGKWRSKYQPGQSKADLRKNHQRQKKQSPLKQEGLKIWTDGSVRESENIYRSAYVASNGKVRIIELPDKVTSNEAEYIAIIEAIKDNPDVKTILSDSKLAVNQLNTRWYIKTEALRALAIQVWNLAQGNVKFVWIPREENRAGRVLG